MGISSQQKRQQAGEYSKVKVLIAGLGSIGRRHLHNLVRLGVQDIILYRTFNSTITNDDLTKYPTETSLEKALATKPDAVIIANPTALHMDVAIPAAQAGCHLFLEKPISHSLENVNELVQIVQQKNAAVFVGYQFRFHPGLMRIKELLAEQAIGHPVSAAVHWGEYLPGWHPWEDYRKGYSARKDLGGGLVLTLSHPLDYLRWLFGDVHQVWGLTGQSGKLQIQVEDTAEIGIRFINGTLGTVHLDYIQRPPEHSLKIIGDEGTLLWNNQTGGVKLYQVGKNEWQEFPVPDGFERNTMFLTEMRHFLDVITGKAKPNCTLDDGIKALELSLAIYDSQDQHRLVSL